ncbi:flagellar biosynthesis protein FlhF [Bacillus xiapuensis]|uniref:flagellar biosynthesis protein FlhF n=1 Tax=Bacillus xiapuensis TaxID=2014075 RepID=UPI000C23869D|nr:flagellar biosynthesis protein FlhF [Bacillus xiapuensis]
MKVKKYKASSMPEAMKKIKSELGAHAVILQSKTVYSGGIFGLFKKKGIEVVAAVDPDREKKAQEPVRPAPAEKFSPSDAEKLAEEIKELKQWMKKQAHAEPLSLHHFPEELSRPLIHLQQQEVAEEFIAELKDVLISKWKQENGQVNPETAFEWSREWLLQKISPIQQKKAPFISKYIHIVGPTGVGKTTTIAKMAANSVLEKKKKVAFITTDTYRIAAIDQLKTYADLLKVPVAVVYKQEEFKEAIERFSSYDIVYIDTAGRNYRDARYVKELKNMMLFTGDMTSCLVMSLTSKEKDLKEIIEKFSLIPIDQFIFTKIDETASYGTIMNLICQYRKGVAFLTNGQDVPDDLIVPDAEQIVHLLLGERS